MASLASPRASQANADTWAASLLHCSVSAGGKEGAGSSAIRAQIHLKSAWVVIGEWHRTQSNSAALHNLLPSGNQCQVEGNCNSTLYEGDEKVNIISIGHVNWKMWMIKVISLAWQKDSDFKDCQGFKLGKSVNIMCFCLTTSIAPKNRRLPRSMRHSPAFWCSHSQGWVVFLQTLVCSWALISYHEITRTLQRNHIVFLLLIIFNT